jgi:hypothetical protein
VSGELVAGHQTDVKDTGRKAFAVVCIALLRLRKSA